MRLFLHGGPSPKPVIHALIHRYMSDGSLIDVGEASIKLIVEHWVNFSYLENPSFPKHCECVGDVTEGCVQRQKDG